MRTRRVMNIKNKKKQKTQYKKEENEKLNWE